MSATDREKAERMNIIASGPTSFECHITIDPVLDEENRKRVIFVCERYGFKLAELVMVKNGALAELSTKDSFMTGHGTVFSELRDRMFALIDALEVWKFVIRRYKIEQIVLDVRIQQENRK